VILADARQPALILLGVGIIFWLVLIYTVFTLFTVQPEKPTLEIGINGTWLVATVATQSISVLSGILAQQAGYARNVWLFFSLCMFLTGCMLYLLIIALIFYRFMFFELTPQSLGHPYWINMGAVAITTLAGTTLIANSSGSPFLMSILPFTTGFTLFFWTTATWWIPLLVLLGIWRFVIHRGGFAYDPLYWSMVFPLGMYTTCTFQLARVNGLEFLMPIPRLFIFAAILAWALTFWGFVKSLIQFFRAVPTGEDP
jgi:tellurite resistance protein TehA-like permease